MKPRPAPRRCWGNIDHRKERKCQTTIQETFFGISGARSRTAVSATGSFTASGDFGHAILAFQLLELLEAI